MYKLTFWLGLGLGLWGPLLSLTSQAKAEDPPGVNNVETVAFGEGRQTQTFNRLRIGELESLETRILYSEQGFAFEGMKGVVLILPGTGGKIEGGFGIKRSVGPLANELVKQKYAVAAFQQPIYADLEKYSSLETNLEWMQRTFDYVRSVCPPGTKINFIGRSTGAGYGLEALHRYLKGDPAFRYIGGVNSMVMMSIDGHTQQEIDRWLPAELKSHEADIEVVKAGPEIFKDMRWQTERVRPANVKVPKVTLAIGGRDEFTPPSISMETIADFERNHPGLNFGLAFHDGYHEPAREIKAVGAGPMSRMRLILAEAFSESSYGNEGRKTLYLPDEESVWQATGPKEAALCKQVLEAGAT